MAKKKEFVDIDFNQNQLLNPVLQNLPEDPSTGVEGQKYFNTTNHIERTYRNGAWQNTTDEYELPAASTNTRGGVKVGNRLYIENEDVLNVHRASKVIEGIGRFATDAEVAAGTQPNVAIDPVQLKSVIDGLPVPMQFKGTVGTGGTYDSNTLPAASTGNTGWTLKVISDGTYQGVTAEAGDTLISNGTTWVLIPSGDEPAQIQADWNQTDNTALDYIKNKKPGCLTPNSFVVGGDYVNISVNAIPNITEFILLFPNMSAYANNMVRLKFIGNYLSILYSNLGHYGSAVLGSIVSNKAVWIVNEEVSPGMYSAGIKQILTNTSDLDNYKTKQTAVVDPTASGTTLDVIDTITQNENGVINATKKTIQSAADNQKGVVELATDVETKAGTDTERVITPHGLASVLPMPTVADADKLLSVNSSGEYELITIINSELIPY